MRDFKISPSRMGRPPLNVKAMLVRLPKGMAERIDAVAGRHKRATFIRAAIEKELNRLEAKTPRQARIDKKR